MFRYVSNRALGSNASVKEVPTVHILSTNIHVRNITSIEQTHLQCYFFKLAWLS